MSALPFSLIAIPLSGGRVLGLHWNTQVQALAGQVATRITGAGDLFAGLGEHYRVAAAFVELAVFCQTPARLAAAGEEPRDNFLRSMTIGDAFTLNEAVAALHRGAPITRRPESLPCRHAPAHSGPCACRLPAAPRGARKPRPPDRLKK